MNNKQQKDLIEREFAALGFSLLFWNTKPTSNGPDCFVRKGKGRPLSVEIKTVKRKNNGCLQTDPVSDNRKKDDLVAIIINSEYVLIDSMSNHLKCCGTKGTRQFTWSRS